MDADLLRLLPDAAKLGILRHLGQLDIGAGQQLPHLSQNDEPRSQDQPQPRSQLPAAVGQLRAPSTLSGGAAAAGKAPPMARRKLAGGLAIVDDFLTQAEVKAALAEAEAVLQDSARAAGMVTASQGLPWASSGMRGDSATWLQPDALLAAGHRQLAALAQRMLALRPWLQQQGYDVGGRPSCQLAWYPGGGARYVRHRDASASVPHRTVTAICYLNSDWLPHHSGSLCIYNHTTSGSDPCAASAADLRLPGAAAAVAAVAAAVRGAATLAGGAALVTEQSSAAAAAGGGGGSAGGDLPRRTGTDAGAPGSPAGGRTGDADGAAGAAGAISLPVGSGLDEGHPAMVVPPLGGRLVVMDSRLLHEVLPAQADRYALTLWFSRSKPAAAAGQAGVAAGAGWRAQSAAAAGEAAAPALTAAAAAAAAAGVAAAGAEAASAGAAGAQQHEERGLEQLQQQHDQQQQQQQQPGMEQQHAQLGLQQQQQERQHGQQREQPGIEQQPQLGLQQQLEQQHGQQHEQQHGQQHGQQHAQQHAQPGLEQQQEQQHAQFGLEQQQERQHGLQHAQPGLEQQQAVRVAAPLDSSTITAPGCIFVSVPAYRDSETQWTLGDLFAQAAHPERVRVGVAWQVQLPQDAAMVRLAGDQSWLGQVRQLVLPASEATGPCKARALAQQLWEGEEFHLQVDSHMRFLPGWDDALLRMLRQAEGTAGHPRVVLSSYPPGYQGEGPDAVLAAAPLPTVLCASHWGEADGLLRIKGRKLRETLAAPLPALFWGAGLSFSRAQLIQEAPYGRDLPWLFFGEESLQLQLMWRRGWDVFTPPAAVAFHLWSRSHRPTFQQDRQADTHQRQRSQRHVAAVLAGKQAATGSSRGGGNDDGCCCLPPATCSACRGGAGRPGGTAATPRSLQQFWAHCGVDFAAKTISDRARNGGLAPGAFLGAAGNT